MNKTTITRRRRILFVAGALILALTTHSARPAGQAAPDSRRQWPTHAPYDAAICAFDKTLTRAAQDMEFRQQLLLSSDSARKAVADLAGINIPGDRVMLFYESEAAWSKASAYLPAALSRSSEKVHVFVLPPFDPEKKAQYKYEDWFICCYEWWVRTGAPCDVTP